MSSKKLNIAIIGCGHWGPNHIRVFNSLSNARVTMAADTDKNRLDILKKSYPDISCETDYQTILKNKDIDAVVVATPANSHFEIVKNALNANKHVLCEKPLCTSSIETNLLNQLANEKKLVLAVGYVFLFNPGIQKLKELIEKGELGTIHYLSIARTNLGPIRSDVNVVFDLISHDISILNYLLNKLPSKTIAVGGSFLQKKIEDVAFVSLTYENNIIANIVASWLDPRKTRQITIVGDKKMALWDDLNIAGPITLFDKGVIKEPYYKDYAEFLKLSIVDKDITIPKINSTEPLRIQNQSFIENIINGTKPINHASFDLNIIKVIETINQSILSNNTIN